MQSSINCKKDNSNILSVPYSSKESENLTFEDFYKYAKIKPKYTSNDIVPD